MSRSSITDFCLMHIKIIVLSSQTGSGSSQAPASLHHRIGSRKGIVIRDLYCVNHLFLARKE